MKYIYALLLFTIPFVSNAQQWNKKNLIKGAVCTDLISLSNGKLIAFSTDGVYGSTDNAENWSKISSDIDQDLSKYNNDVEPEALRLSNDTLYAYFRSNLYRSVNEGINWTKLSTGQVSPDYSSTFGIKNSKLFITKYEYATKLGTLYTSKDAGQTWTVADTISANINIFCLNNELYVWGFKGDYGSNARPLVKKLDANDKFENFNITGLPEFGDLRGMGAAGSNLILMVPKYNQSSTIISTGIYGYNGTTWTKGTEFTENYVKLYTVGNFCFHPFFNANKVLRSENGINWTVVNTNGLYGYYASIRKVNNNKMLAANRAGIFELDSNFNKIEKNNGLYVPSLLDFVDFKSKIYLNSTEGNLYVSSNNALSFSAVNIPSPRPGITAKSSNNNLYIYNSYLNANDKIYISVDGSAWDTLAMPTGVFSGRQVMSISDNGLWMVFTESNIKKYKFYNDQTNQWNDVSAAVPSNASWFNTYRSTNGNLVVVNTYYNNNIKTTDIYQLENNASVWKLLKHKMKDIWYENTSVFNNEFYFLKNAYNSPDSLFKIKNDSVVFEKQLRYGNYKFYTSSGSQSFIYRGADIYCLGFDSTQQNNISIIRSIDAGLTWEAFNKGFGVGTQVSSLIFGSSIIACTNKGLFEFGGTSSFVNQLDVEYSTVYPNPANESIYIKCANAEIIELSVFNINGMEIYKENANEKMMHLDVSGLESGLYFFKIKTSKGVESKKIVIQH